MLSGRHSLRLFCDGMKREMFFNETHVSSIFFFFFPKRILDFYLECTSSFSVFSANPGFSITFPCFILTFSHVFSLMTELDRLWTDKHNLDRLPNCVWKSVGSLV